MHLEIGLFSRFWKPTYVQGPVSLSAVLASEETAQWEYISHASTPSKFCTPAVVLGSCACSPKSEKNQLTNCLSASFTFCCASANLLFIFSWEKSLFLILPVGFTLVPALDGQGGLMLAWVCSWHLHPAGAVLTRVGERQAGDNAVISVGARQVQSWQTVLSPYIGHLFNYRPDLLRFCHSHSSSC